jgi:hypothetical protein
MINKILAFALMLTMVLTSAVGVAATVQVTDITGHRSESAIREAISLGVIKGYPDGTYRPDGLIKREEFFSIINNILTYKPSTVNTKLNFIDVDNIEWYVPIIKTVVEAKITNGIGWEKVGIGLNITNQEAIKILATIIPTKDLSQEPVEILANDKASISEWAEPYYQIMIKKGFVKNTDEILTPRAELTREFAAILLLKIKKGETVIAGNANDIVANLATSEGAITNASQGAIDSSFAGGNGTQADPYQVSTQDQLNHVRTHMTEGAFFVMKNNIYLTKDFETKAEDFLSAETYWSNGNFQPIGTKEIPFVGNFNGNGYNIEGLYIMGTVPSAELYGARELTSYVGLFGNISESSVISNIMIENSQIFGKEYTGGIAGYNQGIIRNAGMGEDTIIKGSSFTGGMAGYSNNLVEKCFSNADIQGNIATGALVGKNYGVLRNSYWLDTSYEKSVGVSGMTSSTYDVKQVTIKEFTDQNIEQLLKR